MKDHSPVLRRRRVQNWVPVSSSWFLFRNACLPNLGDHEICRKPLCKNYWISEKKVYHHHFPLQCLCTVLTPQHQFSTCDWPDFSVSILKFDVLYDKTAHKIPGQTISISASFRTTAFSTEHRSCPWLELPPQTPQGAQPWGLPDPSRLNRRSTDQEQPGGHLKTANTNMIIRHVGFLLLSDKQVCMEEVYMGFYIKIAFTPLRTSMRRFRVSFQIGRRNNTQVYHQLHP